MPRKKGQTQTLGKILAAAQELFVAKGFDGVSISEIARKADINQSLIYHYFESKENLWKEVKKRIGEKGKETKEPAPSDGPKDLKEFLENSMRKRFRYMRESPEFIRMILWQLLEPKEALAGEEKYTSTNWTGMIEKLQQDGSIRKDLEPRQVTLAIRGLTIGALIHDPEHYLRNKKHADEYLELIVDMMAKLLSPK